MLFCFCWLKSLLIPNSLIDDNDSLIFVNSALRPAKQTLLSSLLNFEEFIWAPTAINPEDILKAEMNESNQSLQNNFLLPDFHHQDEFTVRLFETKVETRWIALFSHQIKYFYHRNQPLFWTYDCLIFEDIFGFTTNVTEIAQAWYKIHKKDIRHKRKMLEIEITTVSYRYFSWVRLTEKITFGRDVMK